MTIGTLHGGERRGRTRSVHAILLNHFISSLVSNSIPLPCLRVFGLVGGGGMPTHLGGDAFVSAVLFAVGRWW
jgi:hypothetical protein